MDELFAVDVEVRRKALSIAARHTRREVAALAHGLVLDGDWADDVQTEDWDVQG